MHGTHATSKQFADAAAVVAAAIRIENNTGRHTTSSSGGSGGGAVAATVDVPSTARNSYVGRRFIARSAALSATATAATIGHDERFATATRSRTTARYHSAHHAD